MNTCSPCSWLLLSVPRSLRRAGSLDMGRRSLGVLLQAAGGAGRPRSVRHGLCAGWKPTKLDLHQLLPRNTTLLHLFVACSHSLRPGTHSPPAQNTTRTDAALYISSHVIVVIIKISAQTETEFMRLDSGSLIFHIWILLDPLWKAPLWITFSQ